MDEEVREFFEWVGMISATGTRVQQSIKDLKDPEEEDIQVLYDSYISYQA
jgi:hypothetical protein